MMEAKKNINVRKPTNVREISELRYRRKNRSF